MANKKITLLTPVVTLVWPKLNECDVYRPKKGPPKIRYLTDAKLEPADMKKLQKYLADLAKRHLPDVAKPKFPFKKDKKSDDIYITAASGEKFPPMLVDAKNRPISRKKVLIGGGTKAKLDLSVNFYEMSEENSGINFYLRAVQVLELVEGGFKSNFEEADGFTYSGVDGDDDDDNDTSDSDKDTPDHNEDDGEDAFKF